MNGAPATYGALALALLAPLLAPLASGRTASTGTLAGGLALLAAGGLAAAGGIADLFGETATATVPLGLPWLPLHFTRDPLGGFFRLVTGLLTISVALYSIGYLRPAPGRRSPAPLLVFLPLFLAGMLGVTLAGDAYTFMIFWELMSVASYFLVVFEHEAPANRRAGFLYLLMAQLGGLLILGAFAVLYAGVHSFEFSALREARLSPLWASIAFLLAAFGFGMKAGVVPLHAWLPDAHPAAPSHASALMSGVMIKIAIFGFLRLVWDLLGLADGAWWWGALVLAAGAVSSVTGVLLALQQHELKRLLAYHSVENIGIIVIGIGLGMIFAHFGHPALAALALIAALYHTLNHALFKGLLFMSAGAVLHATHTQEMERLGGLIHRMPVTAALFLIGCIAISALPPFNGFVSEWLTFQAALMAPQLEGSLLSALIPFTAAMLALAGALAAACFVKVFGVVFLGTARDRTLPEAVECDRWMQAGMALPAALCLLLGLLPGLVLPVLDHVAAAVLGSGLGKARIASDWLWLTPLAAERAAYAPVVMTLGLLIAGALAYALRRGAPAPRRGPAWGCGHPFASPRAQYTASGFAQPLRRIFSAIYRPAEKTLTPNLGHRLLTARVRHTTHVQDLAWRYLYVPTGWAALWIADRVARLHRLGIHAYLAVTFITLLVLLGLLG